MPSIPSTAQHAAAFAMHQSAEEALAPGTITLNGVPFQCAVTMGEIERKLLEDGINFREGQDATFSLFKSLLPAAPDPRADVAVNGVAGFKIVATGGHEPNEKAWRITARRWT